MHFCCSKSRRSVYQCKPICSANTLSLDKNTKVMTPYIDVESELLRGLLKDVLKNIGTIFFCKRKLSVSYSVRYIDQLLTLVKIDRNFLYTALDILESCQSWNAIAPLELPEIEHLGLLVDYLKSAYVNTTHRLLQLISKNLITYDLLWAFFKPNALVYATCSATHNPRCLIYNSGEENTTMAGTKSWIMDCNYLDSNGEEVGSPAFKLYIPKFHGAKRINELEVFPIQFHAQGTSILAELHRSHRCLCV